MAPQVQDVARPVRPDERRDGDRLLGDRRDPARPLRPLRLDRGRVPEDHRGVRPRVRGRAGPRNHQEPAGRVHLRRPVAPRGPARDVARHESCNRGVFCGRLAAGLARLGRQTRYRAGRQAARRRRGRDRPDREPRALPLPQGGLPRLGYHFGRPLGRPHLAGHEQPAADQGSGQDHRDHQPPGQVAPYGDARVRDAEPRLHRNDQPRASPASALPRRGARPDDGAGPPLPRQAARLEDLLRVGGRPVRERLVPRLGRRDGVHPPGAEREQEVPADPAGDRDAQGLRAAGLRPARGHAARHRAGGQGESRHTVPRLPLGLRHRRPSGALPRRGPTPTRWTA